MCEKVENKLNKRNGVLFSLFLFQYSLTIPLMSYMSSSIIVGTTSLMITAILIYYNIKTKFSIRRIVFPMVMFIVVFVKAMLDFESAIALIEHYCMFILPSSVMVFFEFDRETFFKTSYKLAALNFAILLFNPFMSGYNYMRFGYGMVLSIIFLYLALKQECIEDKKIKAARLAMLIIGAVELFLYGARGCMISVALFYVLYRFLIHREKPYQNLFITGCMALLLVNVSGIVDLAYELSRRIGLGSYAIAKYRMQLHSGWEVASSGRDALYQESIRKIKQHPFIGNSIGESLRDGEYVHNLFLQVGQDLGVIMLGVLVIILIQVLFKIFSKKTNLEDRLLLCILVSVSLGRLMFSSTLWKRPEFWMMLAFFFSLT